MSRHDRACRRQIRDGETGSQEQGRKTKGMKFKKRLFFPFHVAARPFLLEILKIAPSRAKCFQFRGQVGGLVKFDFGFDYVANFFSVA
jgi:hypothetical protein